MEKKQMFTSLLGLGYNVAEALSIMENGMGGAELEMVGETDKSAAAYQRTVARLSTPRQPSRESRIPARSIAVDVPERFSKGPRVAYILTAQGRKDAGKSVRRGNDTKVFQAVWKAAGRKGTGTITAQAIEGVANLGRKSVESSVYGLRHLGLIKAVSL